MSISVKRNWTDKQIKVDLYAEKMKFIWLNFNGYF